MTQQNDWAFTRKQERYQKFLKKKRKKAKNGWSGRKNKPQEV